MQHHPRRQAAGRELAKNPQGVAGNLEIHHEHVRMMSRDCPQRFVAVRTRGQHTESDLDSEGRLHALEQKWIALGEHETDEVGPTGGRVFRTAVGLGHDL